MSKHCYLDTTCELGPHRPDEHPCGKPVERAGEPCQFCGKPCPPNPDYPDEGLCTDCWTPATIPLLKGMFAPYGISVDPQVNP
jgi:hypothetical protein